MRAIVLHGAHPPGFFSSGADINKFQTMTATQAPFSPDTTWCYDGAEASEIPVIAAIDGFCFGGGLELAFCCAARIASPALAFALPELSLGLIPGLGVTQRLPRVVGFQQGVQMMLTGKPISGPDVLRFGLVDKVVPSGSVLSVAVAHAQQLIKIRKKPVSSIERADKIGNVRECEAATKQLSNTLVSKLSKNGALPQYQVTIDVALYGVHNGGSAGRQQEKREFARLVVAHQSRGSVHTFFATRRAG